MSKNTAPLELVDKGGYERHYGATERTPYRGDERFEQVSLRPYGEGGTFRGYARRFTLQSLLDVAMPGDTILDAGCGPGDLSLYLAHKGFNVIGVDISEEACSIGRQRADCDNVRFVAASLEQMPFDDCSVDHIIGFASLHHFIKYRVPPEFHRVLKPGGHGFFMDPFGENLLFRLFHDREKMARLGDVNLNRRMIRRYFEGSFDVEIIPTDWFSMLDKVYRKVLPDKVVRRSARLHACLDRSFPLPLFLAGVVMTRIKRL